MRRGSTRSRSRAAASRIGQHGTHSKTDTIFRRGFDTDSGLVFKETEVVFRSKLNAGWIYDYKTPSIVRKAKAHGQGPRSLFDMAKIKLAGELRSLTSAHLEFVPWPIAEQVWLDISKRHAETFHAWRMFAMAYGSPEEFGRPEYRYSLELKQPSLPNPDYYSALNSNDGRWMVALRISPKQTSIPDLVSISSIKNVAVLDLSDGQLLLDTRPAVFDERIFRTWAELALAGKAFLYLRVLMFGWQDNISDWLFQYLHCFPSLCHVIMTDCKDMHQKNRNDWESTAHENGWSAQHAKKSVKTLRPLLDDKAFCFGTITNCYYQSQATFDQLSHPRKPEKGSGCPILECVIGTPRVWTHIIDEFPGTRTIWYENIVTNPSHEAERLESSKRVRDAARFGSSENSSPPPKRAQNARSAKRRESTKSISNLLAEFSQ